MAQVTQLSPMGVPMAKRPAFVAKTDVVIAAANYIIPVVLGLFGIIPKTLEVQEL